MGPCLERATPRSFGWPRWPHPEMEGNAHAVDPDRASAPSSCEPSSCEPSASEPSACAPSAATESIATSASEVGINDQDEGQFSHHHPPQPACKACHVRHVRCRMPSGSNVCSNCLASGETCEPQLLAAPHRALAACKNCNDSHLRCRFLNGSKDCAHCVAHGLVCKPRIQLKRGRSGAGISKGAVGKGPKRAQQAAGASSLEQQHPDMFVVPGTPAWDTSNQLQYQPYCGVEYMYQPAAPFYHMAAGMPGYMAQSAPGYPVHMPFVAYQYMMVPTAVPMQYVSAALPYVDSYASSELLTQPPESSSLSTPEALSNIS